MQDFLKKESDFSGASLCQQCFNDEAMTANNFTLAKKVLFVRCGAHFQPPVLKTKSGTT